MSQGLPRHLLGAGTQFSGDSVYPRGASDGGGGWGYGRLPQGEDPRGGLRGDDQVREG